MQCVVHCECHPIMVNDTHTRRRRRSATLQHNLRKCCQILKILSLLDYAVNLQQDPCYISHRTLSMSLQYLAKLLLRTHSTFSKLLMVFTSVSKFGKTNLIFVDPVVKINGTYCCDVLLTEQLLPVDA